MNAADTDQEIGNRKANSLATKDTAERQGRRQSALEPRFRPLAKLIANRGQVRGQWIISDCDFRRWAFPFGHL